MPSKRTWFLPAFFRRLLEDRPTMLRVVANAGWLSVDKIVRMTVGLFVGVWVARFLGPADFGLLSYALAFVSLFGALVNLGLNPIVVRNLVKEPALRGEVLGTTFVLKAVGATFAFIAALTGALTFRAHDQRTPFLVCIIALGMVFQPFDAIDYWFQAQARNKYVAYARTGALLGISLVKVALILLRAPLEAFAWAASGESLLAALGFVVAYRAVGQRLRIWRVRLATAKSLLADSWPLIFSSLAIVVYMRVDQIMLGEVATSGELGAYAVAVRLAEVWYFIPMSIVAAGLPFIVEAKENDERLFYDRLQRLYNVMALLAYALAFPVTLAAPWIVDLLFGTRYERSGPMLAVLIWAGLFTNLGVARTAFLTAMNWTRLHMVTVLLACVLNIVLNVLLIPRYGGIGAAIASVVAYWFAAHGACFVVPRLWRTGAMLTKAMFWPRFW